MSNGRPPLAEHTDPGVGQQRCWLPMAVHWKSLAQEMDAAQEVIGRSEWTVDSVEYCGEPRWQAKQNLVIRRKLATYCLGSRIRNVEWSWSCSENGTLPRMLQNPTWTVDMFQSQSCTTNVVPMGSGLWAVAGCMPGHDSGSKLRPRSGHSSIEETSRPSWSENNLV